MSERSTTRDRRDSPPELRWLAVVSVVETLSLVVLVANRLTVHVAGVASVIGPVHGLAYLTTIALVFLVPARTGSRLLTLVPAVGGLLALRRLRHDTHGS